MRRDPDEVGYLSDCERCMQLFPRAERQAIACGYEPAVDIARPWCHTGIDLHRSVAEDGTVTTDAPKFCAGYTTKLPEVVEASQARLFWSKGELASFLDVRPTEALNAAITILEIAACDMQNWLSTPTSKGGGGQG